MSEKSIIEQLGTIGPLFVAIAAIMWSTDFWVRPILANAFGPTIYDAITLVFFEHIVALLCLLLFLFFYYFGNSSNKKKLDFSKLKSLTKLEAYSGIHIGLASALGNIFFTEAIIYAALSSNFNSGFDQLLFVQKIQPVFAMLLAYYLLKEKFSWKFYVILIPVILGGLFLVTFGQGSISINFSNLTISIGNLWNIDYSTPSIIITLLALAAAFWWGTATVFGKILVQKVDHEMTTLIRYSVASVFLILLNIIFYPEFSSSVINASSTLSFVKLSELLLFIAVIPGVAPLFIYYFGLKNSKASYATIAELAYPFSGVIINQIYNHQSMYPMQWLGGIIIIIAITWFSLNTFATNKQKLNLEKSKIELQKDSMKYEIT